MPEWAPEGRLAPNVHTESDYDPRVVLVVTGGAAPLSEYVGMLAYQRPTLCGMGTSRARYGWPPTHAETGIAACSGRTTHATSLRRSGDL